MTNTIKFKIDSNIPLPDRHFGPRSRYPLRAMKIGDSFFVPSNIAQAATVRSACSYFSIRNKEYRFAIHKDDKGARVWRVKG